MAKKQDFFLVRTFHCGLRNCDFIACHDFYMSTDRELCAYLSRHSLNQLLISPMESIDYNLRDFVNTSTLDCQHFLNPE
jgi:hypothetical protein